MTEFMGLIKGVYEAKPEGFLPGGGSLHSCMTPHGPDSNSFGIGTQEEQKPARLKEETLAFMFESHFVMNLTEWASNPSLLDLDYYKCWQELVAHFTGNNESDDGQQEKE